MSFKSDPIAKYGSTLLDGAYLPGAAAAVGVEGLLPWGAMLSAETLTVSPPPMTSTLGRLGRSSPLHAASSRPATPSVVTRIFRRATLPLFTSIPQHLAQHAVGH